jgi:hypothetical protein
MPRYLVDRAFHGRWDAGTDVEDFCRQILERNHDGEATWLHSYVSDDRRRLVCIYEAPSPEAIRRSAARNGLPVESITSVRILDPHQYFQP